jgi:hypothetical protein
MTHLPPIRRFCPRFGRVIFTTDNAGLPVPIGLAETGLTEIGLTEGGYQIFGGEGSLLVTCWLQRRSSSLERRSALFVVYRSYRASLVVQFYPVGSLDGGAFLL